MNEQENKNLLYVIQQLGANLEDKDCSIRAKLYRIEALEKELNEAKEKCAELQAKADGIDRVELARSEYIDHLECKCDELQAKVETLEERIANLMEDCDIHGEPVWNNASPDQEITFVANVTKVIDGGNAK